MAEDKPTLTPVEKMYWYAMERLDQLEKEGVQVVRLPFNESNTALDYSHYSPPIRLPLKLWTHLNIRVNTDVQNEKIVALFKVLRARGAVFDTGGGEPGPNGWCSWSFDWSFHLK